MVTQVNEAQVQSPANADVRDGEENRTNDTFNVNRAIKLLEYKVIKTTIIFNVQIQYNYVQVH